MAVSTDSYPHVKACSAGPFDTTYDDNTICLIAVKNYLLLEQVRPCSNATVTLQHFNIVPSVGAIPTSLPLSRSHTGIIAVRYHCFSILATSAPSVTIIFDWFMKCFVGFHMPRRAIMEERMSAGFRVRLGFVVAIGTDMGPS